MSKESEIVTKEDNDEELANLKFKKFFGIGMLGGMFILLLALVESSFVQRIEIEPQFRTTYVWIEIKELLNQLDVTLDDNTTGSEIFNALTDKGIVIRAIQPGEDGFLSKTLYVDITDIGVNINNTRDYWNGTCETVSGRHGPLYDVHLSVVNGKFIATYPEKHAEEGLRDISEVRECAATLLRDGLIAISKHRDKEKKAKERQLERESNSLSFSK